MGKVRDHDTPILNTQTIDKRVSLVMRGGGLSGPKHCDLRSIVLSPWPHNFEPAGWINQMGDRSPGQAPPEAYIRLEDIGATTDLPCTRSH